MSFLRNLRLWLRPPRMIDADFGELVFMYISKHPKRSYWEAEWIFPPTNERVFIPLGGDEQGPRPEVRRFYLDLRGRYDRILEACRPRLELVLKEWLGQDLPQDTFALVRLTGFGVEDPCFSPVHWDVSFETTGDKWLGITVLFVGDAAIQAVVDT